MPKICLHKSCENYVWGKKYCKHHQYMRPDIQKKMRNKHQRQTIPIKKQSDTKKKEKMQQRIEDNEFYLEIWDDRKTHRRCVYCGRKLGNTPYKYMFDHVLEKGVFRTLRYIKENVVLSCWDCHQVKTSQKYTQTMKIIIYSTVMLFLKEEKLIQVGDVDIYRLKDWVIENK